MSTSKSDFIFLGSFDSRQAACEYTEPQWEPEPGDEVSDEEYSAWEDRNPHWQMRADFGLTYLNSDFIEAIDGEDRYEYLGSLLTDAAATQKVREQAGSEDNVLVLVFSSALGGFPEEAKMKSTPRLRYCGVYECGV